MGNREIRPIANPFRESVRVLGVYIRGQIIIAFVVTALYAIGFAFAHVPVWYLIAVLAGACNVVPRIGSLMGLGIAALAAYLPGLDLKRLVIVFAIWVVVQGIEGFYLTPKILGKPLGLRPLLVFFALLAGSFLFGPIGFFLAVPALAVANVFWRYYRERSKEAGS
jgi:predicted PurR-regulated permease PerM